MEKVTYGKFTLFFKPSLLVCDGVTDCPAGSDESVAPHGGCNLVPTDTDTCASIGGQRHFRCPADEAVCIPESLLSAGDFNSSDPASCRLCQERSEWRCDDGRCINGTFHRDGRPHCRDSSDEVPFNIYWYNFLPATVTIVILVLCVSLLSRTVNNNVHDGAALKADGDVPDGASRVEDWAPDIPIELIALFEDHNWSKDGNWTLKPDIVKEAKKKYLMSIHQEPILYYHLYKYLTFRFPTVTELRRVVQYLLDWERDIYGGKKKEVLKSWRLRLGDSDLTKRIIESVADKKGLDVQIEEAIDPVRKFFKRKAKHEGKLSKICSILYFSMIPAIEGSFFYFERFKNIIYIHIFYTALNDLSEGNPSEYSFEFFLVLFMSLSVGFVQIFNIFLSVYFTENILEIETKNNNKKIGFMVLSAMVSPILPLVVLSNHIYHEYKLSTLKKHIEDVDDYEEISTSKQNLIRKRVELYQKIQRTEKASVKHRQLYSYYRVVSAVLESCTVLVCLLLLLTVTGRADRDINLMVGVENKLYTFFSVHVTSTKGLFSQLNVMRDFVIFGSIGYGLIVILTALVDYWYQSKNLGIPFKGRVCLGFYLMFLTINKITTAVSLFAITEPLGDGTREPTITLVAALMTFSFLFLLRLGLVYVYKRWFSAGRDGFRSEKSKLGWDSGNSVDKIINVVVNCVVVTPFMDQTDPITELKRLKTEFGLEVTGETVPLVRRSYIAGDVERGNKVGVGDLRSQVRHMWWAEPSVRLDMETVKDRLSQANKLSPGQDEEIVEENIRFMS